MIRLAAQQKPAVRRPMTLWSSAMTASVRARDPRQRRQTAFASALFAAAFALVGLVAPIAQAQNERSSYDDPNAAFRSWFSISDAAQAHWDASGEGISPNVVTLTKNAGFANSGLKLEPRFRVLVLYPKKSSAYDTAMSKILTLFHDRDIDAELIAFNFGRDDVLGRDALALARRQGVDLIFAMGSASTAWLWENYRGGTIPVVSVTSKDPVMLGQTADYTSGSGENFAFTSLNMPVEAQLAYVFQLRPNLRNLAVLVDKNNVSAMETQARPIRELATARGIRVLSLEVQKSDNAKEELQDLVSLAVKAMRKNDVNLENSLFWITGSTSVFREIATIDAHADRVPVLSVVPEVVKEGSNSAVLSIGISFESNAHSAAIYAAKVLLGEAKVGELPVGLVSPPDIAINFRKARSIGLKIPFSFFEGATFIYDYEGKPVRYRGVNVARQGLTTAQ